MQEEFKHWFLPRKNIINCYVVEASAFRYFSSRVKLI